MASTTVTQPAATIGTLTIVVGSPNGNFNQSQLQYSQADAQRLFQAWQNRTNNPTGTVAQFAAWVAQHTNNLLLSWVAQNETTTPAAPTITTVSA